MKNIQLVLIAAMLFVSIGSQAQVNHIRVVNARNFKTPPINWNNPDDVATYFVDLARHKHHEVNVYQYNAYYRISYFQQEGDSVRVHGFNINESGPSFDRASYTWNNDTLNLHLFSSTSDAKSKVYKGYGWGTSSSLKLD